MIKRCSGGLGFILWDYVSQGVKSSQLSPWKYLQYNNPPNPVIMPAYAVYLSLSFVLVTSRIPLTQTQTRSLPCIHLLPNDAACAGRESYFQNISGILNFMVTPLRYYRQIICRTEVKKKELKQRLFHTIVIWLDDEIYFTFITSNLLANTL